MNKEAYLARLSNWKEMILSAKSSGLSVAKWCDQNNVSKRMFYYWQHKIQMEAIRDEKEKQVPETNVVSDLTDTGSHKVVFAQLTTTQDSINNDIPVHIQGLNPHIIIRKDPFFIYLDSSFTDESLEKVLRVISHV